MEHKLELTPRSQPGF